MSEVRYTHAVACLKMRSLLTVNIQDLSPCNPRVLKVCVKSASILNPSTQRPPDQDPNAPNPQRDHTVKVQHEHLDHELLETIK